MWVSMMWPTDGVLLARLVVVPLALVQWVVVLWYLVYWDTLPNTSLKRRIAWVLAVVSYPGIVLAQLYLYRAIAHTGQVDGFVYIVLFVENGVSLVLLFSLRIARRRKTPPRGQH